MAGAQALNAVCLKGKFYVHWMFDTIGHQHWDGVSIGILPTSLVGCALHLAGEKNFFYLWKLLGCSLHPFPRCSRPWFDT